jgi:hypothetical protein
MSEFAITDEYLREAEQRANRFQGAWTGTNGSLAADVRRLIKHVRAAGVGASDEATSRKVAAARFGVGRVRPGSDRFLAVLDEIARLHVAKSLDYGEDEDALANIRAGARAINVDAWMGCVLRISDKLQRIASYCRRGRVEFDGVEDTLMDMAAYSALALVTFRELPATDAASVGCGHEARNAETVGRVGDVR